MKVGKQRNLQDMTACCIDLMRETQQAGDNIPAIEGTCTSSVQSV